MIKRLHLTEMYGLENLAERPNAQQRVEVKVESARHQVTVLLHEWRRGDDAALDRLMPLVYDELRGVAQKRMGLGNEHTLQATELVNEAYLRLVNIDIEWQDRAHFFALAAGMIRRILVDQARKRGSKKRGGAEPPKPLVEVTNDGRPTEDLLALDQALSQLHQVDPRKARVLELRYFGGLTIEETAEALDISHATVERDLRSAKAWIITQLDGAD